MADVNPDRDALPELADEGNEMALDRLADLADARGDVQELSDLLDEGCLHAGRLLTGARSPPVTCASCNGCGTPGPGTPARRSNGCSRHRPTEMPDVSPVLGEARPDPGP